MFEAINKAVIVSYQHYRAKRHLTNQDRAKAIDIYETLIAEGDIEAIPKLEALIIPENAEVEVALVRAYLRKHWRSRATTDAAQVCRFVEASLRKGTLRGYTIVRLQRHIVADQQQWLNIYLAGLSRGPNLFLDKALTAAQQLQLGDQVIVDNLLTLTIDQLFTALPFIANHPHLLLAIGNSLLNNTHDAWQDKEAYAGFFIALAAKHGVPGAVTVLTHADNDALILDAIRYYYLPMRQYALAWQRLVALIEENYQPAITFVNDISIADEHYLALATALAAVNNGDIARALLKKASDAGNVQASLRCAEFHRHAHHYHYVWHYLVLALQQGDPSALNTLEGLYLERASLDNEHIITAAYEIAKSITTSHAELSDLWMYRAIAAGNTNAKFLYAKNNRGNATALWAMAQRLRYGIVTHETINMQHYFAILAANTKSVPAQQWLAERIAQEDGVVCYAKALHGQHATVLAQVDDYLQAICFGHQPALEDLKDKFYRDNSIYQAIGEAFATGRIVKQDMATARFFYLKSLRLKDYELAQWLEHPACVELPDSTDVYLRTLLTGNGDAAPHLKRHQHALSPEQQHRIANYYRTKGAAYAGELGFWQKSSGITPQSTTEPNHAISATIRKSYQ